MHLFIEGPGHLLDHVHDGQAIFRRTGIGHVDLL